MTILITKITDSKFVAKVIDPVVSYMSAPNPDDFVQFENGINAEGETWEQALRNIKKEISKYLSVYQTANGALPTFIGCKTTITTEGTTFEDILK